MSTEQFKDLGHILNLSLRSNPDHEEITALYSEIQSNEPRKSRKNVDESEKRSFFFRVFVVVGMRVNNFLMNWIHPHTHLSTHTHTHRHPQDCTALDPPHSLHLFESESTMFQYCFCEFNFLFFFCLGEVITYNISWLGSLLV